MTLVQLQSTLRERWRHSSVVTQVAATGTFVAIALVLTASLLSIRVRPAFAFFGCCLAGALIAATVITWRWVGFMRTMVRDAEKLRDAEWNFEDRQVNHGCAEVRIIREIYNDLACNRAASEQIMMSEVMQLREFERLKDDFVSTVSHELRTPLTSIRGALSLLQAASMPDLPQKSHDLLRIASQNTERLIRLINDILDIEKMEGGHVHLSVQDCDLGSVVRTTASALQGLALESGVRLLVEGEEHADINGDPDRLVQVFTNLASNAIKFSPRGETVKLRLETTATSALVHVIDHGAGIPDAFRDRVFGKFQQATPGGNGKPGTGLGLAIARAITELHGGSISFETALNKGTTFTVQLPYTPPVAAPVVEDPDLAKILVLDPDESMRNLLETLCAPLGSVTPVRSLDEAAANVRQTRYDAVVLDPTLHGDAGFGFIRQLRQGESYREVPVLVFAVRECSQSELAGVTLSPSHAFIKSRDREQDVVLRLRAVLAVRRRKDMRRVA